MRVRNDTRAFTLVELLVVVAVVAVLLAMLLPSLRAAREQAKQAKCAGNLRQLGIAFHMYAGEYGGRAMPTAYFDGWPIVYWWGLDSTAGVDHSRGFTARYLSADLKAGGVYECPAQARGTYEISQGLSGEVTSTYGYNGYFLSPSQTPGWSFTIGLRPWQNLDQMRHPQLIFAFADSMIEWGGQLKNSALLDPPWLFDGRRWKPNANPTTSFRHRGRTVAAHVDGHATSHGPSRGRLTSPSLEIGYVGEDNAPHYVPDWREW
jgi:prepilin-type N-terminal cleavage/methylation domain-containing protein